MPCQFDEGQLTHPGVDRDRSETVAPWIASKMISEAIAQYSRGPVDGLWATWTASKRFDFFRLPRGRSRSPRSEKVQWLYKRDLVLTRNLRTICIIYTL